MANNSNKDTSVEFRSLSGQIETAEPTASAANANAANKGTNKIPPAGGNTPALRKSSSTTLAAKVPSPATGQSPHTSRNASPTRKDKPTTIPTGLSTTPSAAAIQRALSASSVPQLQPQQSQSQTQGTSVTEAVSKLARPVKSATASGDTTPQWPISPRVKSPPPSGPSSRRGSTKKLDAPAIQVIGAPPSNGTPTASRQASAEGAKMDSQLQAPPPPKVQSRGPSGKSVLETVQENASDSLEPSPAAVQATADLKPLTKISGAEKSVSRKGSKADLERTPGESGSESPGSKSDGTTRGRRNSGANSATAAPAPRTKSTTAKPSYGSSSTKTRPGDVKQGMTVETETVQSIPQSAIAAAGDRSGGLRADHGGSVKQKPSSETIRPKKERKKAERKTRSVNQGTATTKADLFEARVANAVEEANSSDSDETFVYESNPAPEPQRRQRHHSRTPSVTSSHSMAGEQRGAIRNYGDVFDERRVGGKRSMKFSSNPYNDHDSPESNNGTVRSHTPRHIGRHGRGAHHSANHDPDSPFTQASKLRNQHLPNGRSRPNSPKSPQSMNYRSGALFTSNRKQEHPYDFDTEQNADDERTPLMGTVRTPRRHVSRFSNSASHTMLDDYEFESRGNRLWCFTGRAGACVLTTIMLILVVVAAVFFVFASNRPLQDVQIHRIQNVLASEQELMLDLFVGAINPNTLAISIGEMDINVFAKSKHVGAGHNDPTTERRAKRRRGGSDSNPNPIQDPDGHWRNPNDPVQHSNPDSETDAQTMLLGRIFHFDQALSFPASPLSLTEHKSSGQLRLTRPGNKTEAGGSARWEEVIQYPFELIVRGVLKYQLPISARVQSAAVGAKVMVHPEEGLDSRGSMRVEPVDEGEKWEWIEWPEEVEDKQE
ncbi:phospholipid metabolism enzyme regulator like protein [Zymoseptoria brevis]|uniref:Phospholipid metabolism enzyme regulator like protein n=1 Tax=Zymoseptoria brevis TaxID=1047168 RepID=A0A0F4G8J4_9PEZI|nr:phospholipid metabolism enzyme regulator like protein [Zymoseptoria brevis]